MFTLGIETSCDETAAAVVEGRRKILSNIVASQYDLHGKYGGVVPELACRRHIEIIEKVVETALDEAGIKDEDVGLVSVVRGPGLIGALLIGVTFAKSFSYAMGVPLVGVNHIEAHLYSSVMSFPQIKFPAIGLVVSGGHTSLFLIKNVGDYQWLGGTVDDAVGESFDKVASLLGLPYLGGPLVEKLAKGGNPEAVHFPRGMMKRKSYDFSYAGLKTAVLYHIKGYGKKKRDKDIVSEDEKADIAASFQEAAFDVLVHKSLRAADEYRVHSIVIGGGVSQNMRLREMFVNAVKENKIQVFFPDKRLCTDNAAMVAGLGHWKYTHDRSSVTRDFEADPNLKFIE